MLNAINSYCDDTIELVEVTHLIHLHCAMMNSVFVYLLCSVYNEGGVVAVY